MVSVDDLTPAANRPAAEGDRALPHLARITIYPVKSLDGLALSEASVLPGGALEHDRRFALVDNEGWAVNGKRFAVVHQIRSSYDPSTRVLTLALRDREGAWTFHIDDDRDDLCTWFSDHFGLPVKLQEAPETGFPDDTDAPGPTVIAAATLETVAGWFDGLDADECRLRFRANLEIGGVEAFWDDRLYTVDGQSVRFRIGEAVFEGVNPCQRCIVPTRSSTTGEPTRYFQKQFAAKRKETLPAWAEGSRFNHFYRLAVNTRRPDRESARIRVGDRVEILSP